MAAQDRPSRRTSQQTTPRPPVRLSVPVDVLTHAKLCALAALRGVERSELAAGYIRAALHHVVITERGNDADPADPAA